MLYKFADFIEELEFEEKVICLAGMFMGIVFFTIILIDIALLFNMFQG